MGEESEWSILDKLKLLQIVILNKPIGVNKHFSMVWIVDQLQAATGKPFTAEKVWAHLERLYNLKALEDFETIPFPTDEVEFSLPANEFPQVGEDSDDDDTETRDSPSPVSEVSEPVRPQKTRQSADDRSTPKRTAVKRTRSSNTPVTPSEAPSSVKRRRQV